MSNILNQQLILSDETLNSSTTNPISAQNFLNLNQAILDLINDKNITLKELGDFSPSVTFDTVSANLLDITDYINYDETQSDELKLLYNNQLIEKLLGTDYYYVSTNDNQTLSGVLINSKQSVFNYFNINNATTNTIPVTSTVYEKEIGGFYLPNKQSILKLNGEYDYYLDENIEKNKVYAFPDPNEQGNISGLSKEAIENPFKFESKKSNFKNISSSYGRKNVKSNNTNQNFYAYDSLEQKRINNIENFDTKFNRDISNLNNYGFITNLNYDIYGNGFAEFLQDKSIVNNIKKDLPLNKGDFTNSQSISSKNNVLYENQNLSFPKIIEREEKIKNTFVLNKFNNTFLPLSSEFKDVFNEYNEFSILYDELNNKIKDIKIYKDVFTIKTENYYIIDYLNYNEGKYTRSTLKPLILDNSNFIGKETLFGLSNDYIANDIVYKVRISKMDEKSKKNDIYYYEFFGYNTITKEVIDLINKKNTTPDFFYNYFNLDLGRTPRKIINISLSFNKKIGVFNLVTQFNDISENIFIHSLSFKIIKNKIQFIENEIYTPSNFFITNNFFSLIELETYYISTSATFQDSTQGVILL